MDHSSRFQYERMNVWMVEWTNGRMDEWMNKLRKWNVDDDPGSDIDFCEFSDVTTSKRIP